MGKLTVQDVREAVERFWAAFLAKSEDALHSFYASGSNVFQIGMGRSEPGRLGAMRRSREYFLPDTRMDLKLGLIDVVLIGNDGGVATYTFRFQATARDLGAGKKSKKSWRSCERPTSSTATLVASFRSCTNTPPCPSLSSISSSAACRS